MSRLACSQPQPQLVTLQILPQRKPWKTLFSCEPPETGQTLKEQLRMVYGMHYVSVYVHGPDSLATWPDRDQHGPRAIDKAHLVLSVCIASQGRAQPHLVTNPNVKSVWLRSGLPIPCFSQQCTGSEFLGPTAQATQSWRRRHIAQQSSKR